MSTIDPADRRLRRLHKIDPSILDEKRALASFDAINLLRYRNLAGMEVLVVADGTHRTGGARTR